MRWPIDKVVKGFPDESIEGMLIVMKVDIRRNRNYIGWGRATIPFWRLKKG
jgi:hypothetical protein